MAAVEFTDETKQQVERIGSADVVVGIAGAVSTEKLRSRAEGILQELGLRGLLAAFRLCLARLGVAQIRTQARKTQHLLCFRFLRRRGPAEFWAGVSANQRAVLVLAASLNARVCIVLGSDLAALDAHVIQLLAYGVLDRQCGLVDARLSRQQNTTALSTAASCRR